VQQAWSRLSSLRRQPQWRLRFLFCLAALLTVGAHGAVADILLSADRIVVSDAASPSEKHAAYEFQKYWRLVTGRTLPIAAGPGEGSCVWIGRAAVPEEQRARLRLDGLGDDGLIIRTYPWRGDKHLAIVGGETRGTLYGVYEFFERYLGVRWLTPEATHIPERPPAKLPNIDYRFVPPVVYRDISQRSFMTNPEFAVIHRMNGRFVNSERIGGSGHVPAHLGGKIDYVNGFAGWGHTFHTFIHPDAYFDAHPEYFSEINGERQREPSQLCLTNPDVVRIVTEKAKAMLRAEPQARIVSVSQMDWEYYCTCAACRALDAREGGPAGSLIQFINAVAAGVASEFPDAYVDTYAYMYTQRPPTTLHVRDNVLIRLCTFNNDFSKPVHARRNHRNRRFAQDLAGWSRAAKNLFIYDYLPNFHSFQQPNPNLHTIQPNYAHFARHGATGLYAQGNPESPASEFEHLRAYVAAKVMWNPSIDAGAVMREFVTLYYGDAAPYIHQYIQLITTRAKAHEQPITLFAPLDWMDYDTVVRADELFRLAFMNLQDPIDIERLHEAYLPVRYAMLVCKPRVTWEDTRSARGLASLFGKPRVTPHGRQAILERPPSLSFGQYWDLLRHHGVTHLNDYSIDVLAERLARSTPPRRQVLTMHVLEDAHHEVWVAPERAGAVVRWRDKRRRIDWIDAFHDLGADRDHMIDTIVAGDELLLGSGPMVQPFRVRSLTHDRVELAMDLANGLSVTRVIRLDDGIHVETTLVNNASAPLALRVKTHPEFRLQTPRQPQLWIRSDTEWVAIDSVQAFADGDVNVGLWEAPEARTWAVAMKPRGPFLVNTVSDAYSRLYYQTSISNRRVAMDSLIDSIHLAPGAATTLQATYTARSELPAL
jgi:hypothetical protein